MNDALIRPEVRDEAARLSMSTSVLEIMTQPAGWGKTTAVELVIVDRIVKILAENEKDSSLWPVAGVPLVMAILGEHHAVLGHLQEWLQAHEEMRGHVIRRNGEHRLDVDDKISIRLSRDEKSFLGLHVFFCAQLSRQISRQMFERVRSRGVYLRPPFHASYIWTPGNVVEDMAEQLKSILNGEWRRDGRERPDKIGVDSGPP